METEQRRLRTQRLDWSSVSFTVLYLPESIRVQLFLSRMIPSTWSFPREIYFSLCDARKTEQPEYRRFRGRREPIFQNTRTVLTLSLFFSPSVVLPLPRSYFTIPNCGRKSRKRGVLEEDAPRGRGGGGEPNGENVAVQLSFLTCRRCVGFLPFFSNPLPSFLFTSALR